MNERRGDNSQQDRFGLAWGEMREDAVEDAGKEEDQEFSVRRSVSRDPSYSSHEQHPVHSYFHLRLVTRDAFTNSFDTSIY